MSRPLRIKLRQLGLGEVEDRKPIISFQFGAHGYLWVGDARGVVGIFETTAQVRKLRDACDRWLKGRS